MQNFHIFWWKALGAPKAKKIRKEEENDEKNGEGTMRREEEGEMEKDGKWGKVRANEEEKEKPNNRAEKEEIRKERGIKGKEGKARESYTSKQRGDERE